MAGEEWARRILEKELEQDVTINDDGSAPGMYDLRIGPADAPTMAIECVGAVDEILTETWNVGPAEEPLQLSITGDWKIVIAREAKVNKIRQHVERLLRGLEDQGIHNVRVNHLLKRHNEELFNKLESLGITRAYCFRLQGTGEVHLGMSGIHGSVDAQGGAVPKWVGEFLRSPQRADVLAKLDNSGAAERHVFVLVEFGGAPWEVQSYLSGNLQHLPAAEPNLPFPVTGVWIASLLSTQGIRWDRAGWRLFKTREESR
jgi:hypothetical protein